MNYKEKVAKQIHDTIAQMEERLVKEVTDLVVESFKNGVDAGKQRSANAKQTRDSKGRTPSSADETERE